MEPDSRRSEALLSAPPVGHLRAPKSAPKALPPPDATDPPTLPSPGPWPRHRGHRGGRRRPWPRRHGAAPPRRGGLRARARAGEPTLQIGIPKKAGRTRGCSWGSSSPRTRLSIGSLHPSCPNGLGGLVHPRAEHRRSAPNSRSPLLLRAVRAWPMHRRHAALAKIWQMSAQAGPCWAMLGRCGSRSAITWQELTKLPDVGRMLDNVGKHRQVLAHVC